MSPIFDKEKWKEKIKHPLWYKDIPEILKKARELKQQNEELFQELKEEIYFFFENQLENGNVALAKEGKNFDAERLPIDTVVIHHTHAEERLTKERLSAMELLRLYAPYFANPTYKRDKEIKGQPIYSGHFRNEKQVFWPYHWMVRSNGGKDHLLYDDEIGWHAGDWNVNRRSIAIALDGNYEDSMPGEVEINAIVSIIEANYPHISAEKIIGHREVKPETNCPSNLFLSNEKMGGWKQQILDKLEE